MRPRHQRQPAQGAGLRRHRRRLPGVHRRSTVDLGTTYPGQTVRIRFRVGADQAAAATGWLVDDIAFTGLTDTPFATQVTDAAVRQRAGGQRRAASDGERGRVGDARRQRPTDADVGDTLTYPWTQTPARHGALELDGGEADLHGAASPPTRAHVPARRQRTASVQRVLDRQPSRGDLVMARLLGPPT